MATHILPNATGERDLNRKLIFVGNASSLSATATVKGVGDVELDKAIHNTVRAVLESLLDVLQARNEEPSALEQLGQALSGKSSFVFVLTDPATGWSIQKYDDDDETTYRRMLLNPDAPSPEHAAVPQTIADMFSTAQKLFPSGSIEDLAQMIKTKHAVLVMCGAGISVAAGIPDFRTPGTGLYSNLQKYNLPTPESLFTLSFFRNKPEIFFNAAKELHLWPGEFAPTRVHHFIKALDDAGKLLRCYTQNIDCLERMACLPPDKLVEAHGTFASSHCTASACRLPFDNKAMEDHINRKEVARCSTCGAVVKPDVVFFGENLPERFHQLLEEDVVKADLLLVLGTSLKVTPFALIPDMVPPNIPRVLINRERVGDFILPSDQPPQPPTSDDADIMSMVAHYAFMARLHEESFCFRDFFASGDCQEGVHACRRSPWHARHRGKGIRRNRKETGRGK